jgi:hypothetical protein
MKESIVKYKRIIPIVAVAVTIAAFMASYQVVYNQQSVGAQVGSFNSQTATGGNGGVGGAAGAGGLAGNGGSGNTGGGNNGGDANGGHGGNANGGNARNACNVGSCFHISLPTR